MKYIIYIVLINLSNSYCLFGLNSQDTIIIPQITIIEKKQDNFQIDLKLVDSVFISNNLNSSLSEILLKSTSLYSRTYGPGLIASYGIRGSNSAETLVRWNGFTVNNIMLASSDISLFSLASNSKINIDKNSFLPGGIGGSISIVEDVSNDKNKISTSISYSSLNNLN
ncbi:MAG TPA: Plug domain-containing protein, partial [Bacteroidetes bacterium]|nr:Plug domain-containing protein [Bacteroidota bacterium]